MLVSGLARLARLNMKNPSILVTLEVSQFANIGIGYAGIIKHALYILVTLEVSHLLVSGVATSAL